MTESFFGSMFFRASVPLLFGFSPPSATHPAVSLPVTTGIGHAAAAERLLLGESLSDGDSSGPLENRLSLLSGEET
jgi:hypothetical protein